MEFASICLFKHTQCITKQSVYLSATGNGTGGESIYGGTFNGG